MKDNDRAILSPICQWNKNLSTVFNDNDYQYQC